MDSNQQLCFINNKSIIDQSKISEKKVEKEIFMRV